MTKREFGAFETVAWRDGAVVMLDQRLLPHEERYVELRTVEEVVEAIRTMVVRGAPAIGVAAGYGLSLAAVASGGSREEIARAASLLVDARPTAVNLRWGVERVRGVAASCGLEGAALAARLVAEADAIKADEIAAARALGDFGAELVPDGATVLTHCRAKT